MAFWVKLNSSSNTDRLSTIPKHWRPTGSLDTGNPRCLSREEGSGSLFFFLSKAFDKVWKEGLLLKLLCVSVHSKMYKWLSDFLFNRTARAKVDRMISRQVKLREGVPRGGAVSPSLFLVYTTDITTTVLRHVSNTQHADDFAVRTHHHSCPPHPEHYQRGAQLDWEPGTTAQHNQDGTTAQHNQKMVSKLFTLSTSKEKISLKSNHQPVPQVETPKFLGVTLDTSLMWKPHLEAVEAKATRKLAIMKKHAGATLGSNSRHPETGLHRGCKTSRWVCLHNLGYCLKNQQKLARQSAEQGCENHLRCYEKHTNPRNGQDCRPSTFGMQTQVQSCHARGKAEETDQSPTPPETSAWNPKNAWIERASSTSWRTYKKQKQNNYPKESWTFGYTDGSAENAVRNGGAGVYIQYTGGKEDKISLATGLYSKDYKAEAEALKTAASHIEVSTHASPNVVLLTVTDALSVLQALQSNWDTELNDLSTALASLCRPCNGYHPTATCLAMRLLTLWQRRAQQKSKWIGPPATLRWRPSSRPSNTASGGTSTHGTTRLTPTTC